MPTRINRIYTYFVETARRKLTPAQLKRNVIVALVQPDLAISESRVLDCTPSILEDDDEEHEVIIDEE